jgi:hypothetical protein
VISQLLAVVHGYVHSDLVKSNKLYKVDTWGCVLEG